jgi:hypothetical protein
MNPSPPSAMPNLHLLTQTFSQARRASGPHHINAAKPSYKENQLIPADQISGTTSARSGALRQAIKDVVRYEDTWASLGYA